MGIKIEIDLTNLGYEEDPETGDLIPGEGVEDRITNALVAHLARNVPNADRIYQRVNETVDAIIREKVIEVVVPYLMGPIVKHDYSGSPLGEPTSIKAMAMEAVEKALILPANSDYNRRDNLAGLVTKTVDELLKKELKPTIDQAKVAIHRTVIDLAVKGAVEALSAGLKV